MLDINKEEEGIQEIEEETLCKMEDGSHANTSTELSQTQQIMKANVLIPHFLT